VDFASDAFEELFSWKFPRNSGCDPARTATGSEPLINAVVSRDVSARLAQKACAGRVVNRCG
jgi:hypothetical protein